MRKHCKWLVNCCRVYMVDTLHWHTGETDCVAPHSTYTSVFRAALHHNTVYINTLSRTSPQHSTQSVILLATHGQWASLLHRVAHRTSDLSAISSIARQYVWRYNATWSYIGPGEASSLVRQLLLHGRERLACEIRETACSYRQVQALYSEHYKQVLMLYVSACTLAARLKRTLTFHFPAGASTSSPIVSVATLMHIASPDRIGELRWEGEGGVE